MGTVDSLEGRAGLRGTHALGIKAAEAARPWAAPGLIVLVTVVAACGGTVDGVGAEDDGSSLGSGAGGSSLPGVKPCEAPVETRPGPCQPAGQECSLEPGGSCGTCESGEDCVGGRCYHGFGLAPAWGADLMRGLYDLGEGVRCIAPVAGALERVDASLSNDGITAVVMDVYLPCDGSDVLARSVTLPASALPDYPYPGVDVPPGVTFALDPPLAIGAGDEVRVLFRAEGASYVIGGGPEVKSAVSSIQMADVDPDCSFLSMDEPAYSDTYDWDYMARLYVH